MVMHGATIPRSAPRVPFGVVSLIVGVGTAVLGLTAPLTAQPASQPKTRGSSMAKTVPASVGIYAEFDNLGFSVRALFCFRD